MANLHQVLIKTNSQRGLFIQPNAGWTCGQDISISAIIKQTLLHYHQDFVHYHQYFVTLSSRLGYNFDKTLLHYREGTLLLIPLLPSIYRKKNFNRFFLALTLWPPNYSIWIFTHLKLCLADAIHNFKWVKIIQIWQNRGQLFSNIADWCHILSWTWLKGST